MSARVDERHIARGYDPYNSADQPHVMAASNLKRADERTTMVSHPALKTYSDVETDWMMRRAFKVLRLIRWI